MTIAESNLPEPKHDPSRVAANFTPQRAFGFRINGDFVGRSFYSFAGQYEKKNQSALNSVEVLFRFLIISVWGREISLAGKIVYAMKLQDRKDGMGVEGQIGNSSEGAEQQVIRLHNEKTMQKITSITTYSTQTGPGVCLYEPVFCFQLDYLNPLKLIEFVTRFLEIIVHFILTRMGNFLWKNYQAKENNALLRGVCFSLAVPVGIIRFIMQISLGILAFVIRAIASPFKSFHDGKTIHWGFGWASALITAAAYTAFIVLFPPVLVKLVPASAPYILPFLQAGLILLAEIFVPVLTFIGVTCSGLIRDAYIVGKNCKLSPANCPKLTHPRLAVAAYRLDPPLNDLGPSTHPAVMWLGVIVSCLTLMLPVAYLVGLAVGAGGKTKDKICKLSALFVSHNNNGDESSETSDQRLVHSPLS